MRDFFTRYADRIARAGDNDCWIWTGARASRGYGHTHLNNEHVYAHRAAYEWAHGIGSADGMIVRHQCDNPPCCNPAHLLVGTQSDNMQDMIRRGRGNPSKGGAIWTAKLTEADVLEARRLAASGWPIARIREVFPINHGALTLAVTGRTWKHLPAAVPNPVKAKPKGGVPGRGHLLNADMVRAIKARIAAGEASRHVANDFGVSRSTVSAINTGRLWSHVA